MSDFILAMVVVFDDSYVLYMQKYIKLLRFNAYDIKKMRGRRKKSLIYGYKSETVYNGYKGNLYLRE